MLEQTHEEWLEEMREREIRELNAELLTDYRIGATVLKDALGESAKSIDLFIKPCRGDYCTVNGEVIGQRDTQKGVCRYCEMIESGIDAAGEPD